MHFQWSDFVLLAQLALDILLVWTLIYAGIRIIRNNNRTIQILKGILAVFLIKLIAMVLNLQGANYLIDVFLNWGVILVMIILQPEIRGMLEKMGKTNTFFSSSVPAARTSAMIDELMTAVENMSRSKTGALITLQMNQSMQDYEETGIPMDSDVSSELLETIFQYGTPMHDGAVIIEGDKIATAAAYYPSTSRDLPSKYGARHRAAVGISEVTDSITLVVSEETGNISVANRGVLTQYTPQALRRFLTNKLIPEETEQNVSVLTPMINTVRSYSSQLRPNNRQNQNQPANSKGRSDDRVKPMEVVDMRAEAMEEDHSLIHNGRRTGHDHHGSDHHLRKSTMDSSRPAAKKRKSQTADPKKSQLNSSAALKDQSLDETAELDLISQKTVTNRDDAEKTEVTPVLEIPDAAAPSKAASENSNHFDRDADAGHGGTDPALLSSKNRTGSENTGQASADFQSIDEKSDEQQTPARRDLLLRKNKNRTETDPDAKGDGSL